MYCVGNYGELFFAGQGERGLNQINNETSGMICAVPFGELQHDNNATGSALLDYRKDGSLNCGAVVPQNFTGNITKSSNNLVGMGADYCRALSAALFNGDPEAVNIITYPENKNISFAALSNGTIDVLAGALIEQKRDCAIGPSSEGFSFSTPYYFGNERAG